MARDKGKSRLGKMLEEVCNKYPSHWHLVDKSYDHKNNQQKIQGVNYDAFYCEESADIPADTYANMKTISTKPTNPKDAIGIRKAPMSVIPANVLAEVGVALLEGAAKYGRSNYREAGVQASVYYDATMRHLMAYWEGEDTDPDSNLSHVTKAIASLVVLRDAMHQDMLEDDRPPKSKPFYAELNQKAADILDKHADKKPKHITEKNVVRYFT